MLYRFFFRWAEKKGNLPLNLAELMLRINVSNRSERSGLPTQNSIFFERNLKYLCNCWLIQSISVHCHHK